MVVVPAVVAERTQLSIRMVLADTAYNDFSQYGYEAFANCSVWIQLFYSWVPCYRSIKSRKFNDRKFRLLLRCLGNLQHLVCCARIGSLPWRLAIHRRLLCFHFRLNPWLGRNSRGRVLGSNHPSTYRRRMGAAHSSWLRKRTCFWLKWRLLW